MYLTINYYHFDYFIWVNVFSQTFCSLDFLRNFWKWINIIFFFFNIYSIGNWFLLWGRGQKSEIPVHSLVCIYGQKQPHVSSMKLYMAGAVEALGVSGAADPEL